MRERENIIAQCVRAAWRRYGERVSFKTDQMIFCLTRPDAVAYIRRLFHNYMAP